MKKKKTKYQLQTSIQGILAFFDTKVYKPESFSDIESLSAIIPSGGGGTDFSCLFSYIESKGLMPASIVIFTDGKGKYPDEPSAANVPVLWLLNREGNTPPWGRSVRLRNP